MATLLFVPVASATAGDCPVLAFVAQWPEIQPLVSRGQFVFAQMDNYSLNIIIYKQGGSLCSPPAAPDSDTFHHLATYLHTCML